MHRIKPEQRQFATALRNQPTDAERALWKHLRGDAIHGARFRRQFPLGVYVADFLCFERRLIVEVDGGQHAESVRDVERDEWLSAQGFRVLHLWNNEVLGNIEGVVHVISQALLSPPCAERVRACKPGPLRGLAACGSKAPLRPQPCSVKEEEA